LTENNKDDKSQVVIDETANKKENKIEVVDDKDNVNQALIDMIDNPKVTKNKDDEDNVN